MDDADFPLMTVPMLATHTPDDLFPVIIQTNTPEDAFETDQNKFTQWLTWLFWSLIAIAIHKHRYFTQGQRVIHISLYTTWSLESKQADTYEVPVSGEVTPCGATQYSGYPYGWTNAFLMFTNKVPKVFNQRGVYRTSWFTTVMSRLFGIGIPCDCFSIAADTIHEMDLDDSAKPTTIYQLLDKIRFLDSSAKSFLALYNRSGVDCLSKSFSTHEKVRSSST